MSDSWADKNYRGKTSLSVGEALGMKNKDVLAVAVIVGIGLVVWSAASHGLISQQQQLYYIDDFPEQEG